MVRRVLFPRKLAKYVMLYLLWAHGIHGKVAQSRFPSYKSQARIQERSLSVFDPRSSFQRHRSRRGVSALLVEVGHFGNNVGPGPGQRFPVLT